MKSKLVICLLLLCFQAPLLAQEEEPQDNKSRVEEIVNFLEYLLNTLGDPETSARDKDVIVTQSYTKIFRDGQVQVEDDLDENRDVITNKDVTAYLKDVNFFFRNVTFDFELQDIEESVSEDGNQYYKVSLTRNLQGITVTGDTINQTIPRYIEVNLNPEDRDLRIASIYTNELDQNQAWRNWWDDLSYEWRSVFQQKLNLSYGDSAALSQIKSLENLEELDLSGNQYITDIRPLSRISSLKKLSVANTRITSVAPIRNLNKLEELDISRTGTADISPLKYASSIRIFRLSHTPVQEIDVLERMPQLEVLEMEGTFILDFSPIGSLEYLQVLLLNMTEFSDYSLLQNKSSLQVLDISATSDVQAGQLASLTSLRQLYADSTNLASVEPLTSLEKLDLLSINFTQVRDITALSELPDLKRIYCDHTGITKDKARDFMIRNPGVLVVFETEDLISWWNELSPAWQRAFRAHVPDIDTEDKDALARITSLDSLNISDISEIDSLRPLTALLRLESLVLSNTSVSSLGALAGMRDLSYLDFSNTPVKDAGVLVGLTNLEYINASHTEITEITALNSLPELRDFLINDTNVPDSSAVVMSRLRPSLLIQFKAAKLQNWWDTLDDSWRAVFKGVMDWENEPDGRMLHELISRESLETHVSGLGTLDPLMEFVRLRNLDISGTGVTGLAVFSQIPTITDLNVARNPINDPTAIRYLYNLEKLDISNSPISSLDFLENLTELIHVNVSGTQIKRIDEMSGLRQLKYVDCSNTNVKRIDALLGLSLENLKCFNTRINSKRVEEFKQLNPECSVSYY